MDPWKFDDSERHGYIFFKLLCKSLVRYNPYLAMRISVGYSYYLLALQEQNAQRRFKCFYRCSSYWARGKTLPNISLEQHCYEVSKLLVTPRRHKYVQILS